MEFKIKLRLWLSRLAGVTVKLIKVTRLQISGVNFTAGFLVVRIILNFLGRVTTYRIVLIIEK